MIEGFIKVHFLASQMDNYVNPSHIITFSSLNSGSVIQTSICDFAVTETPEQLQTLLKGKECGMQKNMAWDDYSDKELRAMRENNPEMYHHLFTEKF